MKQIVKEIYFDNEGITNIPKFVLEDGSILSPIYHSNPENNTFIVVWFTEEQLKAIQQPVLETPPNSEPEPVVVNDKPKLVLVSKDGYINEN